MSFYFPNVDPVYLFKRKGDESDPFLFLKETITVVNGKVTLQEIPDFNQKVTVKTSADALLTETTNETLLTNEYRVDYSTGLVYFHSSQEYQPLKFEYYGMGRLNFPASRIVVDSNENPSDKTLQDVVSDLEKSKTNWLTAVNTYANIATTYPSPSQGDTVQTLDDSKIYRYEDGQWMFTQQYSASALTDVQNKIENLKKVRTVQEFIATEGQNVFVLNGTYEVGKNLVEVTVGGVSQSLGSGFTENANNAIQLSEGVPAGTKVKVTRYEAYIPSSVNHKSIHYAGGQDELDVTQLKNYNVIESQLAQTENKVGVSYAEFGAVLDGVTDDTVAIRSAHAYANTHGLPIIQRNATFVLNGEVEVKTSVDLTGSTLITSWVDLATIEYNRTSYLYKITGELAQDITSQLVQTEFTKGATTIPSLGSFKSGAIVINTMGLDLLRNDNGVTQNVYKKESNAIAENSGGNLVYPLTKDYSVATSFQVLYKPFQEQLTFKMPKLILKDAKIYSLIRSERNNVEVKYGAIEEQLTAETGISPIYTIVEFYESHNINIDNVSCPIIGRNQKTGDNGLGYLFLFTKTSKIRINNVTQLYGWSGINGNWFRDVTITASNILSVNGHANTYDVTVKDCRIYKDVQIHGGGILDIDNTIFEGRGASVAITTRKDYASEFEGLIRVRNSESINSIYFVQLNDVTHDCGRKVYLPDVEIVNCHMRQPIAQNTYLVTWRGYTGNFDSTLPNIKIDGYSTSKLDVKHKTIYFPQNISNTLLNGTIDIDINGAKIPITTFNSNPYTADLMNIQLPYISNTNVKINLKIKDSLANFSLFGTSNIKIKCIDCDNYSIRTGTNSTASVTTNGEALKLHFENSNIYKGFCDFQTYSASSRFDLIITNSTYLKYTDKNGVTADDVGAYIIDLIKFSSKNKAQATSTLPATNPSRLFNYNDPIYWIVA